MSRFLYMYCNVYRTKIVGRYFNFFCCCIEQKRHLSVVDFWRNLGLCGNHCRVLEKLHHHGQAEQTPLLF